MKKTQYKALLKIFPSIKKYIVQNFVVSIILMILGTIPPVFYALFVDKVLPTNNFDLFLYVVLGYLISNLMISMGNVLFIYIKKRFEKNFKLKLSSEVLWNISCCMTDESSDFMDYKSRYTDDINSIVDYINTQICNKYFQYIIAIFYIGLLITIQPMLAIISIILIPVIFLNTYWRSKKFSPMLEEDYNKRNRLQRLAYSTFIYWKQIKSLNLEDYECIKYNVHLREYGMFREKLNMYNYFNSLLEGFQKTFLVNNSIYFVGCFFIINNYMTMGALLMFVQYFNSFYSSIFSMQNIIVSYQKNLPSLKRFAYLLFDIKKDENRTVVINEAVQSVELKDIIFQYPNSDFRLDVPDLKIFVGDRVAIIGETGSGKTSFLQILLGTQIPNQGKVLINNIDITGTRVLDFNRVFSIVSQENVFFNMSIRDNFLLVNNMATDEMIERCCKAAYIWDKISSLPDGLNTTLGENAECLSHGERQRLAFARAFLNDADIFVLDEVTASLDPFSEGEINKCISQMPKDKTVVMITHKIDKIPDTFKIYTMLDGKISLAET